jgi:hypothetical protein
VTREENGASFARAAGRFVRAAGLAGRAAIAELEQAESSSDQPQVASAPAPTPRRRRREVPSPSRFLDATAYTLWMLAFNAAIFVVVQADTFIPKGTARTSVQLALGAVFLVTGWLFVKDTFQVRQRLINRIVYGKSGRRVAVAGWRSWLARVGQSLFGLSGILWLGIGLYVTLRGLSGLA